jgi:hypothetical protein
MGLAASRQEPLGSCRAGGGEIGFRVKWSASRGRDAYFASAQIGRQYAVDTTYWLEDIYVEADLDDNGLAAQATRFILLSRVPRPSFAWAGIFRRRMVGAGAATSDTTWEGDLQFPIWNQPRSPVTLFLNPVHHLR